MCRVVDDLPPQRADHVTWIRVSALWITFWITLLVDTSNAAIVEMAKKAPAKPTFGTLNELVVCTLCKGYLVDATTIVECLHSFCRSCVVQYLQASSFCPRCEVQLHKGSPLRSLKPDKTLQDIVYKLVPNLFHNEMQRRRVYYDAHPQYADQTTPEQRGDCLERFYSPDDSISLSLEYHDKRKPCSTMGNENKDDRKALPPKRYLKCPALFTVGLLKKFVRMKYYLPQEIIIDIFQRRESLADEYTLLDIAYIYPWKRSEPMQFFYRVRDPRILESDDEVEREMPALSAAVSSRTTRASRRASSASSLASPMASPRASPVPYGKKRIRLETSEEKDARVKPCFEKDAGFQPSNGMDTKVKLPIQDAEVKPVNDNDNRVDPSNEKESRIQASSPQTPLPPANLTTQPPLGTPTIQPVLVSKTPNLLTSPSPPQPVPVTKSPTPSSELLNGMTSSSLTSPALPLQTSPTHVTPAGQSPPKITLTIIQSRGTLKSSTTELKSPTSPTFTPTSPNSLRRLVPIAPKLLTGPKKNSLGPTVTTRTANGGFVTVKNPLANVISSGYKNNNEPPGRTLDPSKPKRKRTTPAQRRKEQDDEVNAVSRKNKTSASSSVLLSPKEVRQSTSELSASVPQVSNISTVSSVSAGQITSPTVSSRNSSSATAPVNSGSTVSSVTPATSESSTPISTSSSQLLSTPVSSRNNVATSPSIDRDTSTPISAKNSSVASATTGQVTFMAGTLKSSSTATMHTARVMSSSGSINSNSEISSTSETVKGNAQSPANTTLVTSTPITMKTSSLSSVTTTQLSSPLLSSSGNTTVSVSTTQVTAAPVTVNSSTMAYVDASQVASTSLTKSSGSTGRDSVGGKVGGKQFDRTDDATKVETAKTILELSLGLKRCNTPTDRTLHNRIDKIVQDLENDDSQDMLIIKSEPVSPAASLDPSPRNSPIPCDTLSASTKNPREATLMTPSIPKVNGLTITPIDPPVRKSTSSPSIEEQRSKPPNPFVSNGTSAFKRPVDNILPSPIQPKKTKLDKITESIKQKRGLLLRPEEKKPDEILRDASTQQSVQKVVSHQRPPTPQPQQSIMFGSMKVKKPVMSQCHPPSTSQQQRVATHQSGKPLPPLQPKPSQVTGSQAATVKSGAVQSSSQTKACPSTQESQTSQPSAQLKVLLQQSSPVSTNLLVPTSQPQQTQQTKLPSIHLASPQQDKQPKSTVCQQIQQPRPLGSQQAQCKGAGSQLSQQSKPIGGQLAQQSKPTVTQPVLQPKPTGVQQVQPSMPSGTQQGPNGKQTSGPAAAQKAQQPTPPRTQQATGTTPLQPKKTQNQTSGHQHNKKNSSPESPIKIKKPIPDLQRLQRPHSSLSSTTVNGSFSLAEVKEQLAKKGQYSPPPATSGHQRTPPRLIELSQHRKSAPPAPNVHRDGYGALDLSSASPRGDHGGSWTPPPSIAQTLAKRPQQLTPQAVRPPPSLSSLSSSSPSPPADSPGSSVSPELFLEQSMLARQQAFIELLHKQSLQKAFEDWASADRIGLNANAMPKRK